ncbi:hypothetical protein ACF1G0_33915 [Streptomyces sp. NPDC013953]|uniref:hypothetical protein n=1 Tax=Streptomyces sp. NPDC013953 TaxID=3364868 RepID=UPI0036F6B01C
MDAGEGHDPWRCLCSTLPAVPVSAALLTPVRDGSDTLTDVVISAGNHIRPTEWLESPDRQAGQRFFEAARTGAAATGLLSAFRDVLTTGRSLDGLVVDYTEHRGVRAHRP